MRPRQPIIHLVRERAGGTVGHALAAGLAARLEHGRACPGDDLLAEAALRYAPDIAHLDLGAGLHTAAAQDAAIHVHADEGIRVAVNRIACSLCPPGWHADLILVSQILQFTLSAHVAGEAILRVVGEHQFEREFA